MGPVSVMHRSVLRRFFPIAPLQSFKPTSGMLYHPSYEEVIEREHREAEQLALGGNNSLFSTKFNYIQYNYKYRLQFLLFIVHKYC